MTMRVFLCQLAGALMLVIAPAFCFADERQIAITFDDAPRSDGPVFSGLERTEQLITALADAQVTGAMFFANTKNLGEAGSARYKNRLGRLRDYAKAGHFIANHTHSHGSANTLAPEVFLKDAQLAHDQLSQMPGYLPFFRFPYLHEGRSKAQRDALRTGLGKLGLRNGYVTVDNYDWYLQSLLKQQLSAGITFDREAWRQLYVDVLLGAVEFYDAIAVDTLGRSPRHVLLLHENDLAALFIGDLVKSLREDGWTIISAAQAYQDPMADQQPETLFLGQGRVAGLAHDAGATSRHMIHPLEDEARLRAEMVRRHMLEPESGAYLGQNPPGSTPVKFAPGEISLPDQYEYGSAFSSDGRTIFFGVQLKDRAEIRTAQFDGERWSEPKAVVTHPTFTYGDPFLSPDETRLYFISNQPKSGDSPSETMDIGFVQRISDGWSEPQFLGAPVNTPFNEYYVSFTDDGLMAFATDREAENQGNFDLYTVCLLYTSPSPRD